MFRSSRAPAVLLVLAALAGCGDDDGSGPNENPLEAFVGTYVLNPAPAMTCDLGALGTATVTIDTVEVVGAGNDYLDLRIPGRATGSVFPVQRFETEFQISADGDGDFNGGQPLEVDIPVGIGTVHGDGIMSLAGEFTDEDTFGALINASFAVALGDATPTDCTEVAALLVTGTRVD